MGMFLRNGLGLKDGHGLALFAGDRKSVCAILGNQFQPETTEKIGKGTGKKWKGMRWSQMWSWGQKEVVRMGGGCRGSKTFPLRYWGSRRGKMSGMPS